MIRQTAANSSKPSRWPRVLIFIVPLLLLGGFLLLNSTRPSISRPVKISALATQQIAPFGEDVLYYDGALLHCLTESGGRRWSFQIGQGAGFSASGRRVAAWSATQLYLIDQDGRGIYNDRMDAQVQFARAGNNYVAAFVGEQDNGQIIVVDNSGKTVETLQVASAMLLDIGFFSDAPELMWTLVLETTGTVPAVSMLTYDPGKLITGNASLGEQLAYRVFYHNKKLSVVDTRLIRTFDYRIKEDKSVPATLIYGWYLQDLRKVGNDLVLLLVPTPQLDGTLNASDLRLLMESSNRVLHFPAPCVGAALGGKAAYGFAGNQMYMCRYGETAFTTFTLSSIQVTQVIGITQNDCAIVAEHNDVYLVRLPK